MDMTCSRCHQAVETGASFCPSCGLPQLVYSAEAAVESGQPGRWDEAVRDASAVAWRPALQVALALGIPAGVLCSFLSPVGIFGLLLMGATSIWVVSVYMRRQRPAWITLGAGARIGLVTGIIGSWTAAATTGITLFAMRYWFHAGQVFDNFWQGLVNQQLVQEWNTMGADAKTTAMLKSMLLAPQGRAAWVLCALTFLTAVLLVFAAAGGALGARLQIKNRRPQP
jgi:hypothetical protein